VRIVVVGGTGRVGSRLCALLLEAGHDPVVASPSRGVDTVTGTGVDAVLRDAQVVVDVSNPRAWDDAAVLDFFRTSTSNLLAAEERGGVGHHVVLSVVGCHLARASGYLRAKSDQERLVESGRVPYTILRATQFFEFVEGIVETASDGTVVRLPPVDCQPIALADVAEVLSELAGSTPVSGVVELAGPELFAMSELARRVLAARGDPRSVIDDPEATYFGARLGQHTLVPHGDARRGRQRLAEWLRSSPTERSMVASGTFDVEITPQSSEEGEGATLGRMSLAKTYHGDLEATGRGTMLTARTAVDGSAGYVAMERVEGVLEGRRGSFVLQHDGLMSGGEQSLTVTIVPDSGTAELDGIRGTMQIIIEDGVHRYELTYELP
jgi:uncharacterized protein YbjT (DUF2867 family)